MHRRIAALIAFVLLAQTGITQAAAKARNIGRIEGRVVGPLGDPMIGVEVWAAVATNLDVVVARSQTDGDGMFVLSRLPIAVVSVFSTAKGHTVAWTNARLTTERPIGGERLRLWPATSIRGRVVDLQGKPVAGALVIGTKDFTWLDGAFRSPETKTDGDGRFQLAGVPVGDQVVRVWADGFVMREHEVFATQDHEVEVKIKRGAGTRLAVRVEGLSGDQEPDVKVWMYPTRNGSGFGVPRELESSGRVDKDGRWEIAGLPGCEWNVQLQSADYVFKPRRIRSSGEDPAELKFTASRIGSLKLHGKLRTVDGRPLAGEKLICRTKRSPSMNGGTPGRCTTDEQGGFSMVAPLSPGEPYSLHLSNSRWVLQQDKVKGHTGHHDERYLVRYEDIAESSRALSLVAAPALFVRGKVVAHDGSPAPFLWCELQVRSGDNWSAMAYCTSQRDGSIAFPGVHDPGVELRVEVNQPVGAAYSAPFRGDAKTGAGVVVNVPPPGKIEGTVLDASGRPMAGARLMMQNYHVDTGRQIDGSWTRVMTDRNGRYAFVGVSPVGHKITIRDKHDKRRSSTEIIPVGVGETVKKDIRLAR